MPITKLTLAPTDVVLPCPFCGSGNVELHNTHTAAYWIACECGAEVSGKAFGLDVRGSENLPLRAHQLAKRDALRAWNRRTDAAKMLASLGNAMSTS